MIEVTHYYGIHQGGTKDYHLYLLSSLATNKHILVKRWGKTGSEGQSKLEMGMGLGDKALDKALNERKNSGYDMRPQPPMSSYASIKLAIENALPRSIQRTFTNAQLATLDPSHDSDKSPFDPLAEERDAVRKTLEAAAEAKRLAEEAESEEILKSNPIYGMF